MARALVLLALVAGCGRIGFDDLASRDGGGDDAPLPVGRWQRVSMSSLAGCGITVTGELWCWGQGFSGQLGTGDTPTVAPPTRVGTANDWRDINLGADHTCGLRADGSLWCWGSNSAGGLGTGVMNQNYATPQQVSPGSLWKAIVAGRNYSCAIAADDELWCWGKNNSGQLATNSTTDELRPVLAGIVPARTTAAIALGAATTCAIDDLRALFCWGANAEGQIGDGTTAPRLLPVAIDPLRAWSAVTAGVEHSCALDEGGAAWCWGRNYEGQLGDGSVTRKLIPTRVTQVPPLVQIVAGDLHTCGTTAGGELWCWGDATRGRISGLDAVDVRDPRKIDAPAATLLATGSQGTCILDDAAHLYCTGSNGSGQTGLPAGEVHTPERSDDRTDWKSIYAHATHACGRITDGRVLCWGRGSTGQLGDGERIDRQKPVAAGSIAFDQVEIGERTSVGLIGTTGYVWGYDLEQNVVHVAPTSRGITRNLGIGGDHFCFTSPAGALACLGGNMRGQLGDGTTSDSMVPVTIPGTWDFAVAGREVSCGALTGTGNLQCWGNGPATGTNNPGNVTTPQGVVGIPAGVTRVELTQFSGCSLIQPGQLWCWGQNNFGEVGDGSTAARATAVRVGARTDWRVVDGGDSHFCAIPADGTLWCWGHDDQGQLGSGALVNRSAPTQVGSDVDWIDVACGDHFTCALKIDGTRHCFGFNGVGQLGNERAWLSDFTVVP